MSAKRARSEDAGGSSKGGAGGVTSGKAVVKELGSRIADVGERLMKEALPDKIMRLHRLITEHEAFNPSLEESSDDVDGAAADAKGGAGASAASTGADGAGAGSGAGKRRKRGRSKSIDDLAGLGGDSTRGVEAVMRYTKVPEAHAAKTPIPRTLAVRQLVAASQLDAATGKAGTETKATESSGFDGNDADLSKLLEPSISPVVPSNERLVHMMSLLKVEALSVVDCIGGIKMWVQLLVPRIESGHNHGVAIQEEAIGELNRVEDSGISVLESVSKYFQTRAKLVSKALKYPQIDDYRHSILECDQMQAVNVMLSATDLRNNVSDLCSFYRLRLSHAVSDAPSVICVFVSVDGDARYA